MSESLKEEEIKITENYLSSYLLNKKLVNLEKYEQEFFSGDGENITEAFGELPLAKPKMYEVRHFIMDLPNGDEKLLLYFHYIKGQSIEKCAKILGISRSHAFRKKKEALVLAAKKYVTERLELKPSLQ